MSLGGAHSLAMYPPRTSHKFLSADEREAIGVSGGIIRLSVGLEDAADLVDDLRQAINAATGVDHPDVDGINI